MNIAILIMAAGLGRRFRQHGGGNKLLAEIDGIPLLSHTLHQALETGEDVYVVTRPEEANIHSLLQGCQRIDCQSDGLGESIAAGVRATAEYQGWIIALGDMPWLQTSSYQAVITALKSSPIVRPVVHGQPGHPVGFSQAFLCAAGGVKK
ncbi:nucleotidyltransferase family protein [Pantoea sp. LMR881]|uniref:nucleotidyltransferase family protein n=1 Tax=Pantoea sp. LMR881 TaxID=3014336 RepID=UPI0022AF5B04|nr:nucleotidyltransferase family protein [Pantoea sp. LMR881]MCZ4058394.1 nucleotidyltransferase family protein [Pantoea sp. LMR881]